MFPKCQFGLKQNGLEGLSTEGSPVTRKYCGYFSHWRCILRSFFFAMADLPIQDIDTGEIMAMAAAQQCKVATWCEEQGIEHETGLAYSDDRPCCYLDGWVGLLTYMS